MTWSVFDLNQSERPPSGLRGVRAQDAFVTIPLIPSLSGEGVLIPAEARRGTVDRGQYRQAAGAIFSALARSPLPVVRFSSIPFFAPVITCFARYAGSRRFHLTMYTFRSLRLFAIERPGGSLPFKTLLK